MSWLKNEFEEIQLFKCLICGKYKPISEVRQVFVSGSILPKEVCEGCLEKVNSGGATPQTEKDISEKK